MLVVIVMWMRARRGGVVWSYRDVCHGETDAVADPDQHEVGVGVGIGVLGSICGIR